MTYGFSNDIGGALARSGECPRSFEDCVAIETAHTARWSGKIAHNTYLERHAGGDAYGVRLHRTEIVTFYRDGRVRLDSGTWQTMTTRGRMNACGNGWRGTGEARQYVSRFRVSACGGGVGVR